MALTSEAISYIGAKTVKAGEVLFAQELFELGAEILVFKGAAGKVSISGTDAFEFGYNEVTIIQGNETYIFSQGGQVAYGKLKGSVLSGITSGTAYGVIDDGQGGLLSINADPTKLDIRAFDYFIDGVKYSIPDTTINVNFIGGDNFAIIGVNASGLVQLTKDTFFTVLELDSGVLEVGGCSTTDGSTISGLGDSQFYFNRFIKNLYMYGAFVKQTDFLGTAGQISVNASFPLRLDMAEGEISTPNWNIETIGPNVQLQAIKYYSVAGSPQFQPKAVLTVDTLSYDNGTDLVPLGNNKYAAHTIARSSRTGNLYFIYSAAEYDNQGQAIDSPINLGGFGAVIANQVEALAKIIVEKGASTVAQVVDIRGLTTSVSSASTSNLQTTYDRSSVPQIELSNGKPLTIIDGAGDPNDIMFEFKSNDGSITYLQLTKRGLIHKYGWKDNIVPFIATGSGNAAPSLVDDVNGWKRLSFGANDEVYLDWHVNHDYAQGTLGFPHIHWMPTTTMVAGQTVSWEVSYIVAKGHQQGESLLATPTTFSVTYTADGTEIAGEHMVTECSNAQAFDLKEPDTVISARIRRITGTYTSAVYGIMADLHYQADREDTPQKDPFGIDGFYTL